MNLKDLTIRTKVMMWVALIMLIIALGIYFSNSYSFRQFGYEKEIERAPRNYFVLRTNPHIHGRIERKTDILYSKTFSLISKRKNQQGIPYQETNIYKTVPVVAAWTALKRKRRMNSDINSVFPKIVHGIQQMNRDPGSKKAVINYFEAEGTIESIEKAGGKNHLS